MLLLRKNQYAKGLEYLKKAEKSNPNLPNIHIELGQVWLKLRKFEDAKRAFKKALRIDDKEAAAYHGLAISLLRLKQYESSAEKALTSIGLLYNQPGAHFHLGEALYKMKRYDDAKKAFEVTLKIAPEFSRAKQWLVKIQKSEVGDQRSKELGVGSWEK